jgi:hypothetical protein
MQTDQEFSSVVQLPQFPGQSVVTRYNASEDPDTGTAQTVELMTRAAIEDSTSPQVWLATQSALRGGARSQLDICSAIYNWIACHVQFRSDDPVLHSLLGLDNELDMLIRPARLLTMQRPAEDCDGFTMLACSMLLCGGVPCEIVTIKADPGEPERFSHVYCQALLDDGSTIVMDCSQAAQHGYPIGWEAPDYFDRKTWGVIQPQQQQEKKGMHGLGECLAYDSSGACTYDDNTGAIAPVTTSTVPPSAGTPFNWNSLASILAQGGIKIAQMQATPVGYVQQANGAFANYGPLGGGAINLGSSLGSVSPIVIIGVLGLGAILLLGKK